MTLRALLDQHRLIVCLGTGGVGKTTLAAALALAAARAGRRAAVLTIDPARALGRAMGMQLENEPTRIEDALLDDADVSVDGTLDAGMLEPARAWDGFVERHAPSPAVARAILDNAFYQGLSRSFAGSTEYVAVEELCRLHDSQRYDLIVLDTPPAAHALDFVRATGRIDRLLDPRVLRQLLEPPPGAARVLRLLERATGRETLGSVSSLVASFERLFDAVRQRSRQSRALLESDETAFTLVTGPQAELLSGAEELGGALDALGIPLRAVIQNRTHPLPEPHGSDPPSSLAAALTESGADAEAVAWLIRVHGDAVALARAEDARWQRYCAGLAPQVARARVAELDHDVSSIADLAVLAERLMRA